LVVGQKKDALLKMPLMNISTHFSTIVEMGLRHVGCEFEL